MTRKEALIASLPFTVPDNMLEKAMIDNSVTGASTYTLANEESIDMCVIAMLRRVLSEPDVQEGGFSISFDRTAVQSRLQTLLEDYDLDESKPTVTSKSAW